MKNAINRALAAKNTKVLFSALCLLVSISVCAENKNVKSDGEATIATSLEADVKPELPVLAPDSMPEFPGGMSAMMTYLMDNVKYPADAKKDKKEGRVACSFVITKEGKVTDAHVVKSSGTESLDNEALRVVNNMPDWKPGKENGEPVNVHYTIPVVFKLK